MFSLIIFSSQATTEKNCLLYWTGWCVSSLNAFVAIHIVHIRNQSELNSHLHYLTFLKNLTYQIRKVKDAFKASFERGLSLIPRNNMCSSCGGDSPPSLSQTSKIFVDRTIFGWWWVVVWHQWKGCKQQNFHIFPVNINSPIHNTYSSVTVNLFRHSFIAEMCLNGESESVNVEKFWQIWRLAA